MIDPFNSAVGAMQYRNAVAHHRRHYPVLAARVACKQVLDVQYDRTRDLYIP